MGVPALNLRSRVLSGSRSSPLSLAGDWTGCSVPWCCDVGRFWDPSSSFPLLHECRSHQRTLTELVQIDGVRRGARSFSDEMISPVVSFDAAVGPNSLSTISRGITLRRKTGAASWPAEFNAVACELDRLGALELGPSTDGPRASHHTCHVRDHPSSFMNEITQPTIMHQRHDRRAHLLGRRTANYILPASTYLM